jgi:hypothetical protein
MKRTRTCWLVGMILLAPSAARARQETVPCVCVPPRPPVTIRLGCADAKGVPDKTHCARTGGGTIDVRQPAPDTVVVTLAGVAVGSAHPVGGADTSFHFDLSQGFTVVFERPDVKCATLTVQGRLVGVLRGGCRSGAGTSEACAAVSCEGPEGGPALASFCLPAQAVGPKDNQSVYVRGAPVCVPVGPGCYTLRETFAVHAAGGGFPGHVSSAEFAPAPALNPAWISYGEPFRGVAKRDFGFQVILKVAPAPPGTPAPAPAPAPKPAETPTK